jgi:class 3 adenylate cyclase
MPFCANCGASLPRGARFCPSCASPVAEGAPGEERKLATVVFADLVGSTALADSQDAERSRALLNRFYEGMASEIAETGGTIEKFIGDAVVAVFGAPVAQEDHVDRALQAALAMRRRLQDLFGGTLRLRIGVNTGDVVLGQPRVGSSFVTGDAVNVAARLEQSAQPGEILVGARTVANARDGFDFGPEARIEAKGKTTGVVCCPLLGIAPLPPGKGAPVFIGREDELARLQDLYLRVASTDEAALVGIVGEPGIGKSALVHEFRDWLSTQRPKPIERLGRCLSFGQASAYAPLGEIVREHRELLDRRPVLGLSLGQPTPPGLHPLAVRELLHAAWLELLAELTTSGPAAVIVEDVHWAEPELLELLSDTYRRLRGPLLLLSTTRDREALGGDTIYLGALPSIDAARKVEGLAPSTFTEGVRSFVVDRSDGNPFFIEELLRMLIDQGVTHELPHSLVLPDTVQALLAARIDLLSPGAKSALQAGAVIGRTFTADPLRALIGEEPPLGVLAGRGFVWSGRDSTFTFTHALTRDVAYGSLTTARRVRIHAGYAAWLEETGGGRDEDAAELAHHYSQAVRHEDEDLAWEGEEEELGRLRSRAVVWLRRAAGLAVRRYEMREAVALLERAVALETDPDLQGEIWQEIAHANALYFDGKAFAAAMEKAIALVHEDAALGDLYAELAFQTIFRAGMWGTAPPSDLVQGWVERALELAAPNTPARAKALMARCYADYDKSADDAAEASAIADRLGDRALRARGYDVRHLVAFVNGDYREALEWCRRAESLVHELDDAEAVMYIHASAISPAVACGELDEARRYAALHDEATRPLSPHHRLHGAALLLLLDELIGNWKQALELQRLIETRVAESSATPCVLSARSLYACALANAHLGHDDETERLEAEAEPLAMSGYGTVLDTPRLLLAIHRGDLTAVESLLGEPAVRTSNWFYLGSMAAHLDGLAALGERERVEREAARALRPGTYLEPFALRALGLVREDEALLGQAAEHFEAFGLEWHAARTRALV